VWEALQQQMPAVVQQQAQQADDGAHLLDGLDMLLEQLEATPGSSSSGAAEAEANGGLAMPPINQQEGPHPAGMTAGRRAIWQQRLAEWQGNFAAAARSVLEPGGCWQAGQVASKPACSQLALITW
jgi:hypothetical protein